MKCMLSNLQPAVFFDRDGVLIETEVRQGKPYAIRAAQDLVIFPAAYELLTKLKATGYKIIVVTNQPDVGNGFVSQQEVEAMHKILIAKLPIDNIYACYHSQIAGCDCRKPKIGMFTKAEQELNIDLKNSFMVGDRNSDIVAGKAAGCFTIFIDYGYNESLKVKPNLVVSSLTDIKDFNFKGVKQYASNQPS